MGGIEAAWLAGKTIKTVSVSIGTTNTFMTVEAPSGTDYQVTAGKKFKVLRVKYHSSVAAVKFQFGYGDTAVAVGTSAPTAPLYFFNSSMFNATVANTLYSVDVYAEVPAAKYPFVFCDATSATKDFVLEGVEEA